MFAIWKDDNSKMIYVTDNRKAFRNFEKITKGPDRKEMIRKGTSLAKELDYLCAILFSNEALDSVQE